MHSVWMQGALGQVVYVPRTWSNKLMFNCTCIPLPFSSENENMRVHSYGSEVPPFVPLWKINFCTCLGMHGGTTAKFHKAANLSTYARNKKCTSLTVLVHQKSYWKPEKRGSCTKSRVSYKWSSLLSHFAGAYVHSSSKVKETRKFDDRVSTGRI